MFEVCNVCKLCIVWRSSIVLWTIWNGCKVETSYMSH